MTWFQGFLDSIAFYNEISIHQSTSVKRKIKFHLAPSGCCIVHADSLSHLSKPGPPLYLNVKLFFFFGTCSSLQWSFHYEWIQLPGWGNSVPVFHMKLNLEEVWPVNLHHWLMASCLNSDSLLSDSPKQSKFISSLLTPLHLSLVFKHQRVQLLHKSVFRQLGQESVI